jgi:prevent-host-death family protein
MKVTAKQARDRLSEMLDRAARGEEVVILRRGKPVVRLVPTVGQQKSARLPDLKVFRDSIRARGKSLTKHLLDERKEARY